jgi:hypothetical protein
VPNHGPERRSVCQLPALAAAAPAQGARPRPLGQRRICELLGALAACLVATIQFACGKLDCRSRRRSSPKLRPVRFPVAQAVTIAFIGAVVSYSVAATLFFVELVHKAPIAGLRQWGTGTLALGAVLHIGYVVLASVTSHTCPVLSSLPLGVSLTAWLAIVLYLWLGRSRLHILGAFMAPLALTLLIGAQFVHSGKRVATLPRSLLASHVTANLLGLALFLMAAGVATFYLVQSSRLKRKDARHEASAAGRAREHRATPAARGLSASHLRHH